MKHTKGNWEVLDYSKNESMRDYSKTVDYDIQISVDGYWICNISKYLPEAKANAKLIAAAPRMLGALKKLVAVLEGLEKSELEAYAEAMEVIQNAES